MLLTYIFCIDYLISYEATMTLPNRVRFFADVRVGRTGATGVRRRLLPEMGLGFHVGIQKIMDVELALAIPTVSFRLNIMLHRCEIPFTFGSRDFRVRFLSMPFVLLL